MTRNKQQQINAATEQLAGRIAGRIIKWQSSLAKALNERVNHLSKAHQKWLLAAFCVAAAGGLILCLISPYGKIAAINPAGSYQPAHIGTASDSPVPLKQTDTINTKK